MLDHIFYGWLNLPWWGYLTVLLVLTQITIFAVTIFLHRAQAHRAVELHPILSHFFRFWLWATTGMVTKEWAAIHRKHHAKCETVEDPHSPQVLSLKTVMGYGTELYRRESKNQETLERYGQGTPDDWIEKNIYTKYSKWGITLTLLIDLVLFGVVGLAIWSIQMAWIPFFAAGIINGVGHYVGYRNFECPDRSANIVPLGWIVGGEELHNNHHTFPTSAKFSVKWYEFDLGWGFLKVASFLGLAKVKRIAPTPKISLAKNHIDLATIKGVVQNRFAVMAKYYKTVILPVFKENVSLANWRKVKLLLLQDPSSLDSSAKAKLSKIFEQNHELKIVYQLRSKLQAIWSQTTMKEKELIEALQKWCEEAENTKIAVLNNFSGYIRSFV